MRNLVVGFAEWSQVVRIVPVRECEGLRMVDFGGRALAGLNGALASMFCPNHSRDARRDMARSGHGQVVSDSLFFLGDFLFALVQEFRE